MPRGGRPLVMAKSTSGVAQAADGGDGVVGQDLVLGHQGAVDVGQQEADRQATRRRPAAGGDARSARCRESRRRVGGPMRQHGTGASGLLRWRTAPRSRGIVPAMAHDTIPATADI